MVKNLPAMWKTWVRSLGLEDPLEEGMATTSNILAWRIPIDRGAWWATVHGIAKSRTWLNNLAQHRVFLISVFVLFISHLCLLCLYFFYVLGKCVNCVSCIFSILFSRLLNIFTIIILNCFSGGLLLSSSYFWSWFLPCSFICAVFLCLFFSFPQTYSIWGLLFPGFRVVFLLPFGFLPLEKKLGSLVCVDFLLRVSCAYILLGGDEVIFFFSFSSDGQGCVRLYIWSLWDSHLLVIVFVFLSSLLFG